jgi:hypothetical protein
MAKPSLRYFAGRLGTVVAIVLVWRGIWYALDEFDKFVFGGGHLITALLGVAIGMALLYLPDRSLKEIEKL